MPSKRSDSSKRSGSASFFISQLGIISLEVVVWTRVLAKICSCCHHVRFMAGESLIANERVETLKEKLTGHPIYESSRRFRIYVLYGASHLCRMGFHVVIESTPSRSCTSTITMDAVLSTELRRFINEIVLGEECDEYNVAGMRRFISHFELYLLSMEEVKAIPDRSGSSSLS